MRYYKTIIDGYIKTVGEGIIGTEITEEEYNTILATIQSRPTPPEGKGYRLKADLTWELYDLPDPEPEEVTAEDVMEALEEIL